MKSKITPPSRLRKYLLRSVRFVLGMRTDCQDFGKRAAELILKAARTIVPQLSHALHGKNSEERIIGGLAILGNLCYENAVESRRFPTDYKLLLIRGASDVFYSAIAEAFNISEREAVLMYTKFTDAITRESLEGLVEGRLTQLETDPKALAQNIMQLIDSSNGNELVPTLAVDLVDRFFRFMFHGVTNELDSRVFKRPGSLVEELILRE
ncbi:hypothetical protein IIA15_10225 [candidate division TA06 bacterium]|nr:hypothetical protein [candidate division TA06 bacterium]